MANIIDRRPNGRHKSSVNRKKFLKRAHVKNRIKDKVKDFIQDGVVSDIASGSGKKINVPIKDIKEPFIHHGEGGKKERVHPGNKDFVNGDRFHRPPPQGGQGSGGGEGDPDGEGTDEFTFSLTREEFLEFFFEDLELPDLVSKQLSIIEETTQRRAGYSSDGNPSRLDMLQSMKQSIGRRFALRNPKKKEVREMRERVAKLNQIILDKEDQKEDCSEEIAEREALYEAIKITDRKIQAIPFIDDVDLRYRQWVQEPVPIHKAVMFCIMDVSGSMDEWKKEMAKRFYMLLYLFLHRNYDKIDLVFIRHHSTASECDEEEFFYGRETGGTVVSPALDLMHKIAMARYPLQQWNIYCAQTSDGDNWGQDNKEVINILQNKILPMVQYYFYIEVEQEGGWRSGRPSDLWEDYEALCNRTPNMDMGKITDPADIYPVFRGLFEKRG
jgi:uncharacterized sporulation protein YeaH/YhbH (DUF444 family)